MFSAVICTCVLTFAAGPMETVPPVAKPVSAGIPILITSGVTIAKVGEIPEAFRIGPFANLAVGYRYNYFGVFWLDFWTWGGEYCLYEDKRSLPMTPKECAGWLQVDEALLSTPFFYRFPLGLLVLGGLLVILIPMSMIATAKERREKVRVQSLMDDSRYQAAVEIYEKNRPKDPELKLASFLSDAINEIPEAATKFIPEFSLEQRQQQTEEAFQAAVNYLVQNGEDFEVAEANFNTVLATLAQSSMARSDIAATNPDEAA